MTAGKRSSPFSSGISETIFHDAPEGIVLIAADSGLILYCNRKYEELTGRPLSELKTMKVWEIRPPEKMDGARKIYSEIITQGEGASSEFEMQRPDGTLVPVEFTARVSRMGRQPIVIAFVRNMSRLRQIADLNSRLQQALKKQKIAEAEIRDHKDTLNVLFDAIRHSIILIDTEGRLMAANEASSIIFGMKNQDMLGKIVFDYFPPHIAERRRALVRQVVETGQPVNHYIDKRADRYYEASIYPVFNSEKTISRVAVIAEDITQSREADRKLREKQKAHAKRLRTLSGRLIEIQEMERRTIALELHDEMGQILTGLQLSLDLLQDAPAAERTRLFSAARSSVSDLLARVRHMSLELRPSMLDDLGLLPAMIWHINQFSSNTHIRVDFRHSGLFGRFRPEIETAAYRIVQESLTNVARHANVGEVSLLLSAENSLLRINVRDRGNGFDPATHINNSIVAGISGMRERVLLLGGNLTIRTSPGKGVALSAKIPLPRAIDAKKRRH